jgi:hypothetical protein
MLKLSTKCWISAIINAQGSRGIIVAVQVGTVKIFVAAAVEPLRKKMKDRVKLRNHQNLMGFQSLKTFKSKVYISNLIVDILQILNF